MTAAGDDGTLIDLGSAELVRLMRAGEVAVTEVMEAHLARIEEVNPVLNAVVDLHADRALEMAREKDRTRGSRPRSASDAPLYGLPVAHKDLIPARGLRFTQGSRLYADRVPDVDHVVVERMAAAGAIAVGKTNVPEFGLGSHSFNDVYGVTRNPWDITRTAGGSSGGAGAALAARMLPLADGSDTGGSLRNPASFCGVTAIRSSPGTVPSWPDANPWGTLSIKGPMGRTVEDVALGLSVLAGEDPRSPMSLGLATPVPEAPSRPLRVAWTPDLGGLATVAAEVTDPLGPAVEAAASALGWPLEEACPDLGPALDVFMVMRAVQLEASLGAIEEAHPGALKDDAAWDVERGRRLTGPEVGATLQRQAAVHATMEAFFAEYDLLLTPACQVAPFEVGTRYPRSIDGVPMEHYPDWMRVPAAITGTACPAMSLPATLTEGVCRSACRWSRPSGARGCCSASRGSSRQPCATATRGWVGCQTCRPTSRWTRSKRCGDRPGP